MGSSGSIVTLAAGPRHTYYPVFDETLDEIIGIVHLRDLATAVRRKGRFRLPVRRVPFIPHSAPLQTVLEQMSASHEQVLVVMDEHGGTAGIVTMEDLFELVLGDLDEENRTPPIVERPDGSLLVRGTVRLDEVGDRLGMPLEDPRVDTLRFVIIGGIAGRLWGPTTVTNDLDICYARDAENLRLLAAALGELEARLRGVDRDLPFRPDAATLKNGDTFTFTTTAGNLDIIGTPAGSRGYQSLARTASPMDLGGVTAAVASIEDLLLMKRAAGLPKDLIEVEILSAVREELRRNGER